MPRLRLFGSLPRAPSARGLRFDRHRAAARLSEVRVMSHSRAVFLMVLVTLMWSMAGVVTRHLEGAESFEVTFWRSGFTVVALTVGLSAMRGASWWREVLRGRWPVWA